MLRKRYAVFAGRNRRDGASETYVLHMSEPEHADRKASRGARSELSVCGFTECSSLKQYRP